MAWPLTVEWVYSRLRGFEPAVVFLLDPTIRGFEPRVTTRTSELWTCGPLEICPDTVAQCGDDWLYRNGYIPNGVDNCDASHDITKAGCETASTMTTHGPDCVAVRVQASEKKQVFVIAFTSVMSVRAEFVAMKLCLKLRVMPMMPAATWKWRVVCEVSGVMPP